MQAAPAMAPAALAEALFLETACPQAVRWSDTHSQRGEGAPAPIAGAVGRASTGNVGPIGDAFRDGGGVVGLDLTVVAYSSPVNSASSG